VNFHKINFFGGGGGVILALICKVHHAPTKRSTSFCILFLFSAVSVIYNFSTVRYIVLLYGTVDVGIFYIMFGYSVYDTCFAEVLQMNSFCLTKYIFLRQ